MTSMTSSVERTDLDFKISVALLSTGKLPRRLAQEQLARLADRAQNDLKCVEGP